MYLFLFVQPLGLSLVVFPFVYPCVSSAIGTIVLTGIINGFCEEFFYRCFLEQLGKDAKISKQVRLFYSALMFSLFHLSWSYYVTPEEGKAASTRNTLIATSLLGFFYMVIYQKNELNFFAIAMHHVVMCIFVVFPTQFLHFMKINECEPMIDILK